MAGINNPIPKLIMKLQGIQYGKNNKFFGIPIIIKGSGSNIKIGNDFVVNSSFLSNLVGLNHRSIIFARNGGNITIGNNVGISGATLYARCNITIGDNTMIGGNTKIIDNDFHPVEPVQRLKTPNDNIKAKPINIGNNVFVGCNCIITKGVTIGDNTTIGAGSVVCSDIPDNCVAGGNPAKVIKVL